MIEDGCLDGVDAIYGAHVWSSLELGTVGVRAGDTMAASDRIGIKLHGRGGHGAKPHFSVDPVLLAADVVSRLQQIVSRQVDPLKPAVLTIASIHAGSAFNVIPDTAELTGTVRTFDDDVRVRIEESIDRIVQGTCAAVGASAEVTYRRGYPPVRNHAREAARIESVARRLVGEAAVSEIDPSMGGEDFAYYLQKVPGCFFFVGGGNEERGMTYPHHHPRFDVDERAMLTIGKMFCGAVFAHAAD